MNKLSYKTEIVLSTIQYRDSAGSWHTEVYPTDDPGNYDYRRSNDLIARSYGLTRFGAWMGKYTSRRKATKYLKKNQVKILSRSSSGFKKIPSSNNLFENSPRLKTETLKVRVYV